MVSAGEMITSLDTPVDLVPMSETNAEEAAGCAATKPRLLHIIWSMALYTAIWRRSVFRFAAVWNFDG